MYKYSLFHIEAPLPPPTLPTPLLMPAKESETLPPPVMLSVPEPSEPTSRKDVTQVEAPLPPPTLTTPVPPEFAPITPEELETAPPPVILSDPEPFLPIVKSDELVHVELPLPPPTLTTPLLP